MFMDEVSVLAKEVPINYEMAENEIYPTYEDYLASETPYYDLLEQAIKEYKKNCEMPFNEFMNDVEDMIYLAVDKAKKNK